MKKKFLLLSAAAAVISAPAYAQTDHEHEDDEIIVTGSPLGHPEHESIVAATVLTREDIVQRNAATIGEMLRNEPGVSSTFFGPGASRPIIRGLSADRIRVLDSGIGSIDVSQTSDDHAVAAEPATAQRIEIIRGPASLYYGSSAAGGVVNVFDGRIPSAAPEDGLDAAVRFGLGTVDDSFDAAGGFDVVLSRVGDAAFVLHGQGAYREADDYEIPGEAESERLHEFEEAQEAAGGGHGHEEEEEGVFGLVENTDLETKSGAVGASLVFDDGFFGVAFKTTRSRYGVPGDHHHEEEEGHGHMDPHAMDPHGHEEEEEEGVAIDLEQERFDVMGELNRDVLIFQSMKMRFGYADYIHQELEGDEIGTTFTNEGYEGRLEFVEKSFGNFRGASGVQFRRRDFSAVGEEAFTPPNVTEQVGLFTVREYETDKLHLQVAGRYENTHIESETVGREREFDTLSVSAGVGFEPTEQIFFGVNGYRTERAPAGEELYSNGAHLATNTFEIGNPFLGIETARGLEATLHFDLGRLSATANGFYTDYSDFIALLPNGQEIDELPVFLFEARDAEFRGFEVEADADLFAFAGFDVAAHGQLDYTRAEFKDGGGNVPRIPPLRSIIGLEATSDHLDLSAEFEVAAEQEDVSDFELGTDGYEVINLGLTYRPFGAGDGVAVRLQASNITDEEVRQHTSFLKDIAPQPGRNFRLSVTAAF